MSEAADSLESVRTFRVRPVALLTALLLGAVSGTAAAAVRWLFRGLQWAITQNVGLLPRVAAEMPLWRRAATPIAGAVCATVVVAYRARRAQREHRQPRAYGEYVEAVRLGHGNIPFRPNVWRTLASAFSVATGASIGREGSMIQFAAASTALVNRALHRWVRVTREVPSSLAVACGVAAGVTAAYQAPLAGMFFAIEIVLGMASVSSLLLLALAAAMGEVVSRAILGGGPLYPVYLVWPWRWVEAGEMLGLALLLGALGPVYQGWLRLWSVGRRLPLALVWAGVAVGLLSLLEPRVWGNGDVGLADALGLRHLGGSTFATTVSAMALLLGLRLLASGIATGLGTVGGVFTPTMFTGAVAASLLAHVVHRGDPAVMALVGMAALVAAATHAPLMAAFMAVELTGSWTLLPELLVVSFVASALARRLSPSSLYAIASEQPLAGQRRPGRGVRS